MPNGVLRKRIDPIEREQPMPTHPPSFLSSRRKPIAACVAVLFALASPLAKAVTFVTNCNDGGIGSLRAAVSAADEGGTVDMRQLTTASPGCSKSTITLTTGDIPVHRDSVTILGPGENFVVTGKKEPHRLFTHDGVGTFEIDDLTLNKGYAVGTGADARGGCVSSTGSVTLKHVTAAFCYAYATSGDALGGAVFTSNTLSLHYSAFIANQVGAASGGARGGAIRTFGSFYAYSSTIKGNIAGSAAHPRGFAGGMEVGSATKCLLSHTTVSGNTAYNGNGGMRWVCSNARFVDSTISGNVAQTGGGGYIRSGDIGLYNSTIAFNYSVNPAHGLSMLVSGSKAAILQGMLIANNTYGAAKTPDDFASVNVIGSNNLIFAPASSVPADTIAGQCARLLPLADNGGPTQTHALHANSPAVDKGINPLALTSDQRGAPFVRESGPPGQTALPDIGAYELDRSDAIFDDRFEACF